MTSPLHTKREQAASWYDARAGAHREAFFKGLYARKAASIRRGEHDHRLDRMIAEQVEYDGDGA